MQEGDDLFPQDANGNSIYSDVPFTDTWKAMEKLVEKGLVKSIGVSNFNSQQIIEVLAIAEIPPVTNQVRYAVLTPAVRVSGSCRVTTLFESQKWIIR